MEETLVKNGIVTYERLSSMNMGDIQLLETIEQIINHGYTVRVIRRSMKGNAKRAIGEYFLERYRSKFQIKIPGTIRRLAERYDYVYKTDKYNKHLKEIVERLKDDEFRREYMKEKFKIAKYHLRTNHRFLRQYDIRWTMVSHRYVNYDPIDSIERDERIGKYIKENSTEKLITFIMPVKNRSSRAEVSALTLVTEENYRYANFMIVEDEGEDNIDIKEIRNNSMIEYYRVRTGKKWTRGGLLNFGIQRTMTEYYVGWDCDFLFQPNIAKKVDQLLRKTVPRDIVGLGIYETEGAEYEPAIDIGGTPYGNMWIYPTERVKEGGGYNKRIEGWGLEERYMEMIIGKPKTLNLEQGIGLHMSHGNQKRGDKRGDQERNRKEIEKVKRNGLKGKNWEEYEMIIY